MRSIARLFANLGRRQSRSAFPPCRIRPVLEALEDRLMPSTLTVLNLHDNATYLAGDGSLRGELAAAQNGDTIQFNQSLAGGTITLADGQLELSKNVTILGPAAGVTVSGGNTGRVLLVDSGVTASLSNLTITGGNVPNSNGGGIDNTGSLTLTNCTVAGNSAQNGGGIENDGAISLLDCTVSGNSASANGGGIHQSMLSPTIYLTNCTVADNTVGGQGGGIQSEGTVDLTSCTVTANHANLSNNSNLAAVGAGGGVAIDPFNSPDGIHVYSYLKLADTIVDGNFAGTTSVVADDVYAPMFQDNNPSPPVVIVPFTANYSLIGSDGGAALTNASSHNQIGVNNAGLAPLGNYGGLTQTVALLPGSPATDAGSNALAISTNGQLLPTDQRGYPFVRSAGAAVDIGSYESQNLVVSDLTDENDGNYSPGHLSLREALQFASAEPLPTTITFDPSMFATPQTINLGSGLQVSGSVTIAGPATGVTLHGSGATGALLLVNSGAAATISNLTITGGSATDGGGLSNNGTATFTNCNFTNDSATEGGGIYNAGNLKLTNCSFTQDSATDGGGLFNTGTVTLTQCTLSQNSASAGAGIFNSSGTVTLSADTISANNATSIGGGFYNQNYATLMVTGSTVAGNTATYGGGGIFNSGTVQLVLCTFSGNSTSAGDGGAIDNYNTAHLFNCTLANNSASGNGGGIADDLSNSAVLTLTNCTVTANHADTRNNAVGLGGGILNASGDTLLMANTIVAGNFNGSGTTATDDIHGSASANFSLIGNTTGATVTGNNNLLNVNAMLGALANNGGVQQTVALLPASPAIDAGSNALAVDASGNLLTTDGRGTDFPRFVGATVDIGAYEVGHTFVVSTAADENDGNLSYGHLSLREALALASQNPDPGPETILFDTTVFATAQTITLTGGPLELSYNVTITGPAAGVWISGNNASQVFLIDAGVTATLSGLNVVDGFSSANGGAIANLGNLTLTNSTISGSTATDNGGGIYNTGTLALNQCSLSGNSTYTGDGGNLANFGGTVTAISSSLDGGYASSNGGSLANENDGSATLTLCDVSNNLASGVAGGVFNDNGSTVTLTNSTVAADNANGGEGGIVNAGTLTIVGGSVIGDEGPSDTNGINNTGSITVTGATVSNGFTNASGGTACFLDSFLTGFYRFGGGLGLEVFDGTVALSNCTIAGANTDVDISGGSLALTNCTVSTVESGILTPEIGIDNQGGSVSLANALVAGNQTDITGAVTANYSLIGNTSGATLLPGSGNNVLNVNANLGFSAANGGPTSTIPLLPGSPAIAAGSPALAVDPFGNPLTTDQRGAPFAREHNNSVDIGAFEAQNFNVVVSTATDENDGNNSYGHLSLREALAIVNENPAGAGNTITFDPTVFATPQTITLTGGALVALTNVTITAPAAGLTITTGGHGNALVVGNDTVIYSVTLSGLTFSAGSIDNVASLTLSGCTLENDSPGDSALVNNGYFTATGCTFTDNNSAGQGSAVYNSGSVTLNNCDLTANTANNGGAIYDLTGYLTVNNCTFSNNAATDGGAIDDLYGILAVNNCTFSDNTAIFSTVTYQGGQGGAIDSAGAATITGGTFSGNTAFDGAAIFNSASLTLSGVSLSDNSASAYGGAITGAPQGQTTLADCTLSGNNAGGDGGGIDAQGEVVLTGCVLSGNTAGSGGALCVEPSFEQGYEGNATLTGCTLSQNQSVAEGGAIFDIGILSVADCTFAGNVAGASGGGIKIIQNSSATVTGSTFDGNSATQGGAIANGGFPEAGGGAVIVTNSTIFGNTATQQGGGLYSDYDLLQVTNCTVTANTAPTGAGIFADTDFISEGYRNTVLVQNTISDGNDDGAGMTVPDDVNGPVTANYDLFGSTTNASFASGSGNNLVNIPAVLGPLANNGGPTPTCALLPGSPAVDAGSNVLAVDANGKPLTTDQRGQPRIVGSAVDLGAYEAPVPVAPSLTVSGGPFTYDAGAQAATVTVSGTVAGDPNPTGTLAVTYLSSSYDSTTAPTAAGTYTVETQFTSLDPNYTSAAGSSTLVINPAALALTANNESKTYGSTFSFVGTEFSTNGLFVGDTVASVTLTSAGAPDTADVSIYAITPSAAVGSGLSNYTISYVAGNLTVNQANQAIAFAPPASPTVFVSNEVIDFNATASSGLTPVFSIDPSSTGTGSISGSVLTVIGAGTFVLDANQAGNSNYNPAPQVQQTLVINPASQTISLIAPTSPIIFSANETVSLSASGGASGNPVNFRIDASSTGTGNISGSVLTITGVGTFVLDANQAGNSNYNPAAQVQQTLVVNPNTRTTIQPAAGNSNPSTYGQPLTFTATVSNTASMGGTPTGMVTFYNGTTALGTRSLSKGTATLTLTTLPAGTSAISATYDGSATFAVSSSPTPVTQTVGRANTSTSAVSAASTNGNPSMFGQPLTFTATVTSATGAVPTGLVAFYNGSTDLGARSLGGGTATITLTTLPAGTDSITAVYLGSANFANSSSPPGSALTQTVHKATTTSIEMAASTNPATSTYGQSLTFTATVTCASGIPIGAVTFYNGITPLGTRSLVNGTATLTVTTLPGGTASITATYLGESNFASSASPSALTETVALASTNTRVTASPSPVTPGQMVTLTATVTNTSGTGAIPTGTVTFKDVLNGVTTALGTRSLVNGVATYTTSNLPVGSYTIEAFYNVTIDFLASSGDILES